MPLQCTQVFGGAGHHRDASMHHSVHFECEQGTAIIAVGDGVILKAIDTRRLGAGHVDLLPLANVLKLQLDVGCYVACYLHFETGSALAKAGDRVKLGNRLASTGNVGFTTGPHLHFQLNTGPEEEDSTLMYGFRDDVRSCVVPVAGYSFNSSGLNPLKLASHSGASIFGGKATPWCSIAGKGSRLQRREFSNTLRKRVFEVIWRPLRSCWQIPCSGSRYHRCPQQQVLIRRERRHI